MGEAADGGEPRCAVVAECRPDVALVDARMPRMDGVELIARLADEHPAVAAIVLSTFDEDDYIFGALRGGAARLSAEGLLARGTGRGHPPGEPRARPCWAARSPPGWSPSCARAGGRGRRSAARSCCRPGSSRWRGWSAAGAANREIAARLFITEGTVKNHVSSMLRKLGLRDRTQLALRLTGR